MKMKDTTRAAIASAIIAFVAGFLVCAIVACASDVSMFNTMALEQWCKGETGIVRMVGAYEYKRYSNDTEEVVLLEDETGNVWSIDAETYSGKPDDFLLLWIDDNHTTANQKDDIVVKVWIESHG